jgi:dTDP-glucose 4,6-dehydratase
MYKKILITGAAGFIGSHLAEKLYDFFSKSQFILFDKITYAANKKYIKKLLKKKNVKFIKNDLLNLKVLETNLKNVDLAINVAAESHVDNSFGNSLIFTKTNTLGTHYFLEACRKQKVRKIIHVSTDEVYGENLNKPFKENQSLNPTNPYSASKAGADMLVNAYKKSYKLNINTVRANNIYGTRQYPEKLISKTIYNFIHNKKMTIHGRGNNYRYYLSVQDFCDGILQIIKKGKFQEIYNIASDRKYKVTYVIKIISDYLNKNFIKNIKYVNDRPFNDKIYVIDCNKLKKLSWRARRNLEDDIPFIIDWYKINKNIFKK